jgi:acetyl-CoA carboxylase biotin carboxyl carrier protein
MTLSFKEVAEILRIIDSSQCEEVILDLAGVRLEVRRGASPAAPRASMPIAAPQARGPARASAGPGSVAPRAPVAADAAEGTIQVRAPMVGTFYRRPSPNDKPFVEPGHRVRKGDPLCLIEVMKLYTTIAAPADGIVKAIAAEDGALVAFDQLLIAIEPA